MTKKQFKEKVITLRLRGKLTPSEFQWELNWLDNKGGNPGRRVNIVDLKWLDEMDRKGENETSINFQNS